MHTYTWSGCREDRKSCESEVLAQVIEDPWPQYWKEEPSFDCPSVTFRKKILEYLGRDVQRELTKMCGKKQVSLYGVHSVEKLQKLSWDGWVELESRAPTFHAILKMCVEVKRRIRPSKHPRQPKRTYRPSNSSVPGVFSFGRETKE